MGTTTIKIYDETKHQLDMFREYKNESYDEVIKKIVFVLRKMKTKPELSIETVKSIEEARRRMRAGNFVTESEAKKRLGF